MEQIHIQIDKIESVRIRMEKKTDYKWFVDVPPKEKLLFGFIPMGMTRGIPSGWSTDWNESHGYSRYGLDYFDTTTHRINNDLEVSILPNIIIYLRNGHTISQVFDTDNEAQDFVGKMLLKTKKEFQVIVR